MIMIKKFKKPILIYLLAIAAVVSISAGDDYFEVSKNIEIFSDIYKELDMYYVDDIKPNELMRTGIDAMLQSLDPYTNFISEAEMENYRFQTTGKYGGIGAIIRKKDNHIAIIEPHEDSPAREAGLQAGDLIIEVSGESTKGKNVEEISKLLKGAPGTKVELLIRRTGFDEDKLIEVTREEIEVENVPYYGMINDTIGFIKLTQFRRDAGKDVGNALKDLKKNNDLRSLVLDLRGNPGGLLNEAVNVSNLFIPKNKHVVSTKGKVDQWNRDFKTLNQPIDTDIPLVVLMSNGSASASEIVAGTIQDYDRGIVVGQRSFGKGLVQNTRELSYNTMLKLTTAKYYIPSGRCIQAIDYSIKNEDGQAGEIPDSLKTKFETANGRTVYDGAGIYPDIDVEKRKLANISVSLLSNDLIFDYATKFYREHDSIAPAKEFHISEDIFQDFKNFLADKEYHYTTRSEETIDKLEKQLKKEEYFDAVNNHVDNLKSELQKDKSNDLEKFKEEIKQLLDKEIVGRYYSKSGEIQSTFDHDPELKKATSLLINKKTYYQELKPAN